MTFRRNVSGPQFKLCLMLCAMSVSSVAFAQGETGAGNDTSSTTTNENATATAEVAPKAEASATGEAVAKGTVATTKIDAGVKQDQPPAAKPEAAAETAPAETPITVEVLPGSGYPEPKVRGIVGGSLWLTMPGYQFPYMPALHGKSGVRVALSGNVWDDTSYARIKSGTPETADSVKRWANQARAVLRATPTYSTKDDWFVQGQLEVVGRSEQTTINSSAMGFTDDLYVRAGKWNVFDITAGRFQGWEVYHYGMGLDLNTLERRGAELPNYPPPQIYGVDRYWDRPGKGAGSYAAHVYFTDYLRLEVLGQIGTETGNVRGVRPVAILDLGYFKLKAGAEYGATSAQQDTDKSRTKNSGVGGAAQFILNPHIEGGINAAIGYLDVWNNKGLEDPPKSTTTKSIGGFINGRVYGPLILGVGANNTLYENLKLNGIQGSSNYGLASYTNHFQGFFAVQYSFWDKLFIKFVGAYASSHYEDRIQEPPHPYTHKMTSGRLRVMYLF